MLNSNTFLFMLSAPTSICLYHLTQQLYKNLKNIEINMCVIGY